MFIYTKLTLIKILSKALFAANNAHWSWLSSASNSSSSNFAGPSERIFDFKVKIIIFKVP